MILNHFFFSSVTHLFPPVQALFLYNFHQINSKSIESFFYSNYPFLTTKNKGNNNLHDFENDFARETSARKKNCQEHYYMWKSRKYTCTIFSAACTWVLCKYTWTGADLAIFFFWGGGGRILPGKFVQYTLKKKRLSELFIPLFHTIQF